MPSMSCFVYSINFNLNHLVYLHRYGNWSISVSITFYACSSSTFDVWISEPDQLSPLRQRCSAVSVTVPRGASVAASGAAAAASREPAAAVHHQCAGAGLQFVAAQRKSHCQERTAAAGTYVESWGHGLYFSRWTTLHIDCPRRLIDTGSFCSICNINPASEA